MPDLMSGRVAFMFDNLPSALPAARAGKVKALAQTCAKRSPSAPDLPTMEEAGFPDFAIEGWYGIFAPARTPKPIVDKLSADINKVLKEPESMEKWKTLGFDPIGTHARGLRRASEGRPRLLEEDDRLHRHQGGMSQHGVRPEDRGRRDRRRHRGRALSRRRRHQGRQGRGAGPCARQGAAHHRCRRSGRGAGLRRHPHALRRAGAVGSHAHHLAVAWRHHGSGRQLRLRHRADQARASRADPAHVGARRGDEPCRARGRHRPRVAVRHLPRIHGRRCRTSARHQCRGNAGPHAAAALGDGRGGDRARRPA